MLRRTEERVGWLGERAGEGGRCVWQSMRGGWVVLGGEACGDAEPLRSCGPGQVVPREWQSWEAKEEQYIIHDCAAVDASARADAGPN